MDEITKGLTPRLAIRLFDEDVDPTATHPVLGQYVETYWGMRVGPSSICAVRRMVTVAHRPGTAPAPCAVGMHSAHLAKLLGGLTLSKLHQTFQRLDRFSPVMVRRVNDDYTMVAIPLRWSTVPSHDERAVELSIATHKLTA